MRAHQLETFTRRGVRYKLSKTHGSRWSPGKVHIRCYISSMRDWVFVCVPLSKQGSGIDYYYAMDVSKHATVTCRKCIAIDPRRPENA